MFESTLSDFTTTNEYTKIEIKFKNFLIKN